MGGKRDTSSKGLLKRRKGKSWPVCFQESGETPPSMKPEKAENRSAEKHTFSRGINHRIEKMVQWPSGRPGREWKECWRCRLKDRKRKTQARSLSILKKADRKAKPHRRPPATRTQKDPHPTLPVPHSPKIQCATFENGKPHYLWELWRGRRAIIKKNDCNLDSPNILRPGQDCCTGAIFIRGNLKDWALDFLELQTKDQNKALWGSFSAA